MILLVAIFVILLWMVVEAFSFTLGAFIFLDFPFWDGWNAAWDKPVYLFLVALVAALVSGADK